MSLDHDVCYRAVAARDPRFDGRFFTAVRTTHIYCRPVCPARTPLKRNVEFYASAAAAEEAGFRACMRCRPDTAPGTPAWAGTAASVTRALRLIDQGVLDADGVDALAARVGMTSRHLRRLFDNHLGAGPIAIAQARRVHFARRLVEDTPMSMTDVAYSAGFQSIRRFNTVFQKSFGRAPSALRRAGAARGVDSTISFELVARPPFDAARVLTFAGARAMARVETVEGGVYRRWVGADEQSGAIAATPGGDRTVRLSVPSALASRALEIVDRTRTLFDMRCDPDAIASHLTQDPMLRPLVRRYRGLRIPGAWSPFETMVRAILGQQITVVGATTLARRIVEAYGEPVGKGAPGRVFPRPAALRRARLERLGLTKARAASIRALARAMDGALLTQPVTSLDDIIDRLTALSGIGPWTAHYVAMRVFGEPDAFPSGDLALQRAACALEPSLDTERRLIAHAEQWRPWRAYATMFLWTYYTEELLRS